MLRVLNTRFWICVIVSVISVYLVIPTIRYFKFVDETAETPLTAEQKKTKAELMSRSIKLGLDLQGGVDFLLAVDVPKVKQAHIEQMADAIRRDLANEKIPAEVRADFEREDIIVSVNERKDAEIAIEQLKRFDGYFNNPDFNALARGEARLPIAKRQLDDYLRNTLEGALRVVRNRVDEFGLTQPVVARQGNERIRVQIPGETDPDKIQHNLLRPATLEFRLLHPEMAKYTQPLCNPDTFDPRSGVGEIKDEFLVEELSETGSLVKRLKKDLPGIPPGFIILLGEDTRTDFQTHQRITRKNLVYLVKDKVEVRGDELKDARPQVVQTDLENPYKVSLEFDRDGARKFAQVTRDNVGKPFAIILENLVYSAPVIRTPIPDGRCVIEGSFTLEDVRDLSQVLKAGALPAPLRVIEKRAVEASLGTDSIVASTKALGIGGLILILFMIVYYGRAGVVAVIAMTLNVLLILAFLSMAGATLTLSGIGGILLTLGMAVDANVLIYERLREELSQKKPLKAAIAQAFGRAFTVIFDSNITSLLPALALLLFEVVEGSVKGFWITLAVGLLANLYTGVTVTRALAETWIATRGTFSAGRFAWFRNPRFPFMNWRFGGYVFSGILALLSIGYIAVHGVNYAVDFTGGVLAHISVEKELGTSDIRAAMARAGYPNVAVQKVLNKNEFLIRQKIEGDKDSTAAISGMQNEMEVVLGAQLKDAGVKVIGVDTIASEVGSEFRSLAFKTILVASICILLYIGWRFQPVFGIAAVIALVHDLLLTLGVFTLMGRELNLDIISALLIILGYSVNDTIVVFDRIRELAGDTYGKNFRSVVDQAVNMSLNRTINTGGTTLITVGAMILFGGRGLGDFALVLFIGILFGTYSSTFIASALSYEWIRRRTLKAEAEKASARDTRGRLPQTAK